jgi:phosphate/phosphite/phosphonate ABC transporter binding protein
MAGKISFGLIVPPGGGADVRERVGTLAQWMTERFGLELERVEAASYESLAEAVRSGKIDAAWLPPIVFVRLEDVVDPIGSIRRGGGAGGYEAALVVRGDEERDTVTALRGARAGWVDRWSAAGFVLPRVKLALSGVDPRTIFRTETFHGSHRGVLRALRDGACDVVGTYARANPDGKVTEGAWTELGVEVRVLTTFGEIPPDVIATRRGIDDAARTKLRDGLALACKEQKALMEAVFNGSELEEGLGSGYEALKTALDLASSRGLFD